jgi:hypothetical protein
VVTIKGLKVYELPLGRGKSYLYAPERLGKVSLLTVLSYRDASERDICKVLKEYIYSSEMARSGNEWVWLGGGLAVGGAGVATILCLATKLADPMIPFFVRIIGCVNLWIWGFAVGALIGDSIYSIYLRTRRFIYRRRLRSLEKGQKDLLKCLKIEVKVHPELQEIAAALDGGQLENLEPKEPGLAQAYQELLESSELEPKTRAVYQLKVDKEGLKKECAELLDNPKELRKHLRALRELNPTFYLQLRNHLTDRILQKYKSSDIEGKYDLIQTLELCDLDASLLKKLFKEDLEREVVKLTEMRRNLDL